MFPVGSFLFRFSFAGETVAGFIWVTFDEVAFRHFTKKCFANQVVDLPIPPDVAAGNRKILFLGSIYLIETEIGQACPTRGNHSKFM